MTDAGSTILVVEDDPGLCAQYRWSFPNCRVLIAGDRRQAELTVRKEKPAVALLDLGLPPDAEGVSEGFATLEMLHQISPEMPVVVASIAHSLAVSVSFSNRATCVVFQSIHGCRSANHERTWASSARMPGRTRETTK